MLPVAPLVEADGLVLCALEMRDADALLLNDRDAETARRFGWDPADAARWRCERHIRNAAEWWRTGERAVFAVRRSLGGPLLGVVEARRSSPPGGGPGPARADGSAVELSWAVLPEHRNRGIGSGAVRALVAWCASVGVEQVWATVEKANPASLRVARAAGFEPVRADERWVYLRACAAPAR
jgi:RimJ/RimL family protein N-acetyltransferase